MLRFFPPKFQLEAERSEGLEQIGTKGTVCSKPNDKVDANKELEWVGTHPNVEQSSSEGTQE